MNANELAFIKSLEQSAASGLTTDRMMELVFQKWEKANADNGKNALRLTAGTTKDNKPVVEISWGPLRGTVEPQIARGYGTMFMMCAESAETNAFLISYFAKAKDQTLAKKLVSALIPALNTFRAEKIEEACGPSVQSADAPPPPASTTPAKKARSDDQPP